MMEELGISHALIAFDGGINRKMKIPNPDWTPPLPDDGEMDPSMMGAIPGMGATPQPKANEKKQEDVPQFLKPLTHRFKVHFLWRPTSLSQRLENRQNAADSGDASTEEGDT